MLEEQSELIGGINITERFFDNYFDRIHRSVTAAKVEEILQGVELIADVHSLGGKVILAGNGGSAAMASHVAVDLVKAAKIRAINFNEADLITCFANDYGYENWVANAVRSYADPADLLILISSSGQSKNMINAALMAKKLGLRLITLSGFNETNPLKSLGQINLWVHSSHYNTVEMTHHIWLLSMVDYLAEKFSSSHEIP